MTPDPSLTPLFETLASRRASLCMISVGMAIGTASAEDKVKGAAAPEARATAVKRETTAEQDDTTEEPEATQSPEVTPDNKTPVLF